MKSSFAAAALAVLLAMNLSSGWTQGLNRQMFKIESSLRDEVDTRISTEQLLDTERKCRSRVQVFKKK